VEVLGYVANTHGVASGETIASTGNAVFAVTPRRRGAPVSDEARRESTVVDSALIVYELTRITAKRVSTGATISKDIATGTRTRTPSKEAFIWVNARTTHGAVKHNRGASQV
jgi:hypothetical protein